MPQDVLVEEQKCGNRNCRNAFQFRLRRTYGALFNLCVPVRMLWNTTVMGHNNYGKGHSRGGQL